MKLRNATLWVMLILMLLGVGFMLLRYNAQRQARLSPGDRTYRLRYSIDFEADEPDANLHVFLPRDTQFCRIYRETISHPGSTSTRLRSARSRDQTMTVESNGEGGYEVVLEFDIHVSPKGPWREDVMAITPEDRAVYLRPEPTIQSRSPVVTSLLNEWKTQRLSPEQLLARIFDHCSQLPPSDDGKDDAESTLTEGAATATGRAAAMVSLCRAAKVPARLVSGIDLQQATSVGKRIATHVWVEVYAVDRWVPFDPEFGYAHQLPPTVLPIRRGGTTLTRIEKGDFIFQRMTAKSIPPPRGLTDVTESAWMVLDLTRLPLDTQQMLALLLILPIGALVTAVFRVMIGVPTFGTFTPALLAISFVYAAWHTGIVILVVILLVGIVGRRWLDRLKLLLVPRLGVILTLVVLCMIFAVSLFDYTRLTAGPQAVLLPIVILTMLVERVYITGEEDGVGFTLKRCGGTGIVAVCCYVLMRSHALGEFLVTFPEVHLITAALLIGAGRYAGYRLTELWRFYDLVQLARNNAAFPGRGNDTKGKRS